MVAYGDPSLYCGPAISLVGVIVFTFTYSVLGQYVPATARKTSLLAWKWRNTANSLIHSFVSGVSAFVCLYLNPELAEDVVGVYTSFSHLLLSFSTGYFLFDFVNIIRNNPRSRSTYELIVHHAAVTLCFAISTFTKRYVGFGIVSLLVEVNSIFLHMRQLLQFQEIPRDSNIFRFNSFVNIGTFLVFRLMTLAWMARWLVLNPNVVPFWVYMCGCVSVTTICLTSTVLFFRLLNSDFFRKHPQNISSETFRNLTKNGVLSPQIIELSNGSTAPKKSN